MLSIGEFSKICKVTTRTLRHYDDIDLIKPAEINSENSYRFYSIGQIRTMLLISRLKNYSFSLDEIKTILNTHDNKLLIEKIKDKKNYIEITIKRYKYIEHEMENDLLNLKNGVDIMSFIEDINVSLIKTQDINILSNRQIMSVNEYGKYIGNLFEEVSKKNLTVLGCPMSIYHDNEFNPNNNDTEVALPIKEKINNTRVLKGHLCAMVTFEGPYSNLSCAYGKITEWINLNNYKIIDLPYEKYINGPMDGKIITEIYFPVERV
ncbi:GyrI-like domain-containing protein [Clostridium sp. ZBS15]|uniref:MerR family transcriptional regulator n=1 Tax=Clostridium sp. ZBS15 TaxID=2949969 RepID=UPI00207A2700|nr:GyrI-like domain-containing protein [Clostridium sp. ZBS15]